MHTEFSRGLHIKLIARFKPKSTRTSRTFSARPSTLVIVCVCVCVCVHGGSRLRSTTRWPSEVAAGQMVRRSVLPRARSHTHSPETRAPQPCTPCVPWQQNTYCNDLFSCRLTNPTNTTKPVRHQILLLLLFSGASPPHSICFCRRSASICLNCSAAHAAFSLFLKIPSLQCQSEFKISCFPCQQGHSDTLWKIPTDCSSHNAQ